MTPDFAAYLSLLPSKRRVSIRAERRRIEESGVEVRVESGIPEPLLPRLGELETALLNKHGIDWRPELSVDGLRRMHEVFGSELVLLTAFAEGQVRGFTLVIPHGDHWYVRQTGFDYAFQQRHRLALYYELCFYRPLEEAAARGVRVLCYGLGSTRAKQSRGCQVTEQRCYFLDTPAAPGREGQDPPRPL